jgi:hypothetical protein
MQAGHAWIRPSQKGHEFFVDSGAYGEVNKKQGRQYCFLV